MLASRASQVPLNDNEFLPIQNPKPLSNGENPRMSGDLDDGTEMKLDQALLDFMRRFDSGNQEDRETFLKEHPEIAAQLKSLLEAADWIEEMAGPTLAEAYANTPAASEDVAQPPPFDGNSQTLPLGTFPANPNKIKSKENASIHDSTLPPNINELNSSFSSLPGNDNSESMLPCRFGDYVLEKILGRGGMGVVYLAYQVQLHRRVAIKMIRSGCLASEDEVVRFYSEARSAASLMHPNIVTVYHCGEYDGHHFFSMDYVPGTDLAKMLAAGPMPPKDAVRYVRDIARAIDYAHREGVVHRDLKPANVLIDEDDQVVLTDFGLAKQIGAEEGLTATGATLGTPSYMSPEQATGKREEQGASTDVYAIGAILYALLTGKPPFQGETVMQTMMHVVHRVAPTVRQTHPNIHVDLDTIVTKCLEKSPARRYATAADLADDLDRFYTGQPIKARPPSLPRRIKHWVANIPLVAALTGTRNIEPTFSQRLAQNLLIAAVITVPIVWFFGRMATQEYFDSTMPNRITIASGTPGGMYYELAGKLSHRLQTGKGSQPNVIATNGSLENLRQLLSGQAELALIQESTVRSDQISVVAPLFYEAVHILVPADSSITQVDQLANKRVIMGTKESGTRQAALRVLKHFGIHESDMTIIEGDWNKPQQRQEADAIIAVIKVGQKGIADLLSIEKYRLISLPDATELALKEPMFRLYEIHGKDYSLSFPTPVRTLATTALLVVKKDAPSRLVEECLTAIYAENGVSEGLIPKDMAASWQGLPYHEAARKFYYEPD